MAIHEGRRTSFGAQAELYDEVRHRYVPELFESIAEYAGLSGASRALEIGAGTGIATLPMAERGVAIDAVEPSEEMAAVAQRKFGADGRVRFHIGALEQLEIERNAYDLVYAAQAWHWIDPARRCDLVADALRPGGAVAIFGHAVLTHFEEAQEVYRKFVPEWFENYRPLPPIEERLATVRDTVASSPHFHDVETRRFPWTPSYSAKDFVRLMSTASDHAIVPEPRRSQMFDALAQVIEDLGGRVERPNETLLVLARVAPSG